MDPDGLLIVARLEAVLATPVDPELMDATICEAYLSHGYALPFLRLDLLDELIRASGECRRCGCPGEAWYRRAE